MRIDNVGSPRKTNSDAHPATNHHGASHHLRTPHVTAANPATSTKIAAAPLPSGIGGTA